jgi:hypothetical protein
VPEAFTWAKADNQIGTKCGVAGKAPIGEVYEILTSMEPGPDELR